MTINSEYVKSSFIKNPLVKSIIPNVKSDVIIITEDRLENILIKHLHKLVANSGWKSLLSIFISISVTLLTANFDTDFILLAAEWALIFKLAWFLSAGWLLYRIYRAFSDRGESSTTKSLIDKIKAKQTG